MICAVVDGISTGSLLLEALHRRGAHNLHVRTFASRHILATGISPPPDGAWVTETYDFHPGEFDALAAWAGAHGVEQVLAGSEPAVEVADRLAEALGLAGNSTDLSVARRDKEAMVRALEAAGVPTPGGLRTSDLDDALRFWREELGAAPAVVKPLRSTGGDGVTFCDDEASIRAAFGDVLGAPNLFGKPNEELLIQRMLDGRLFEVCTVSHAGRHEVVMMVETTKHDAVFEMMRVLTSAEVAMRQAAVEIGLRALNGLGIRYGAAHVEVLLTDEGPFVIEVAARLIGLMSPKLCRAALGTDQVERLVDVTLDPAAIDSPPPRLDTERFARSLPLRSDAAGIVRDGALDEIERRLMDLPSAFHAGFRARAGYPMPVTVDLPTAPGVVELLHERLEQVETDHAAVRAMERNGMWRSAVGG